MQNVVLVLRDATVQTVLLGAYMLDIVIGQNFTLENLNHGIALHCSYELRNYKHPPAKSTPGNQDSKSK